jgi:hypothetical protein
MPKSPLARRRAARIPYRARQEAAGGVAQVRWAGPLPHGRATDRPAPALLHWSNPRFHVAGVTPYLVGGALPRIALPTRGDATRKRRTV